jgi:hypothetical protein
MATLSQLPSPVDLSFVAGDTFRIRVRVIDPATTNPLPLVGPGSDYTFRADIVKDPERTIAAEFQVTPDPDDPTHAVVLNLPPSETAPLPASFGNGTEFKGMWDLEVEFPNGDIRTVAKGTVLCYLDITNTD